MSSEVLSQSEIDALLSALSTGEMDAEELRKEESQKKVKTYDFKRALRFSKDQIRSLTRIHENFARLLTTYFSTQLRTYVQISVASVDQIPYEEFIRSIPKMTILNVFEVLPLEGRIVMEVNPNIAYAMMDRVLGGSGASVNKVNNLTEIETRIMSNLFEKGFENLQEAWSTITEINPNLTEFEVNPQFLQMVSPNETVIVISLNTQVGDVTGMINICIPHVVLEPIISKLSVHYWGFLPPQTLRKPALWSWHFRSWTGKSCHNPARRPAHCVRSRRTLRCRKNLAAGHWDCGTTNTAFRPFPAWSGYSCPSPSTFRY